MNRRLIVAALLAMSLAACGTVANGARTPAMTQTVVTFVVPHDQALTMMLPVYAISQTFGRDPDKCAALLASLHENIVPSSAKVVALVAMADKAGHMHRMPAGNTACVATATAAFTSENPAVPAPSEATP
jgi:hypothetical protein